MSVRIQKGALSIPRAYRELASEGQGGIVLFLGRVRADRGRDGPVEALEYEAHRGPAEAKLEELAKAARRRFGVREVVLWHRVGVLAVGEASVLVGAGAPHRSEAFAAVSWLITRLKERAPIWKAEIYHRPIRARARRRTS